ncbi:MAG: phosphatase PAP2 family protein [Ignavibacteriae bacterium]|nr:phosphatase PAP2 family protein [Ignavibacteriota bacterium]
MNLSKAAKYISYLLIPPVMNLFIFIIFSVIIENEPNKYYGILISFVFGLLFPLLAILYFRKKGIISNNDATIKEERNIPYIYAIIFSLSGLLFSAAVELHYNLIMLWMVYLVTSIFIININKVWKISAHALGASIPVGALYYLENSQLFIISVIILFIVSLARLQLKVHTFMQVLAGSFLGFSVSYILLKYCNC